MLQRSFKTAQQLGITQETYDHLLYALETLPTLDKPKKVSGVSKFGFNMCHVEQQSHDSGYGRLQAVDFAERKCGTAGCILGLMRIKLRFDTGRTDGDFDREGVDGDKLYSMFFPENESVDYEKVTNRDAAAVIEHFLTTGDIDISLFPAREDEK